MATIISTTFRLKRGLAAKWQELNLVLDPGEPGFELDTYRLKIGDGQTAWNDLPYIGCNGTGEGGEGIVVDTVLSNTSLNPIANKTVKAALDGLEALINDNIYNFGNGLIVTEVDGIKTVEVDPSILNVDVSNLATKEEVRELAQAVQQLAALVAAIKVPTKLSELENDVGYLTEHQDLSEYAKKEDIPTDYLTEIPSEYITEKELKTLVGFRKYEILPVEGMIVKYTDDEIRLNTQRVQPTLHSEVGEGGNPNMYYVTLRVYAPEGATTVLKGEKDVIDPEVRTFSTDSFGRKFISHWLAIANTSNGGASWTKWGDSSTIDKYLGFYLNFHWYNEDKLISTDKVRIILTNDKCHDDLVPDATARRIDEKVGNVAQQVTEINQNLVDNYVTIDQAVTKETVESIVEEKVQEVAVSDAINYGSF